MTLRRVRMACWMPKATNAHSECVILIVFPLQQWLHGRASILRYTYIACHELVTAKILLQRWKQMMIARRKIGLYAECSKVVQLRRLFSVRSLP